MGDVVGWHVRFVSGIDDAAYRGIAVKGIKCVAFDCFGTVFDMSGVSRDQIRDYVDHVRKETFSPYGFPREWWELKCHPDAAEGVKRIQALGIDCITLSNGDVELLDHVSANGGICWNHLVDLAKHRVYKPNVNAYWTVMADTGHKPAETLMVTANPTFGDIEGAQAIGMRPFVIRNGYPNTIIELAEMLETEGV